MRCTPSNSCTLTLLSSIFVFGIVYLFDILIERPLAVKGYFVQKESLYVLTGQ